MCLNQEFERQKSLIIRYISQESVLNGLNVFNRFRRGQSVQVEQKSGEKFPAMISAIGTEAIWVRRTSDNTQKIRIYLTQLTKGKFILKRRAV